MEQATLESSPETSPEKRRRVTDGSRRAWPADALLLAGGVAVGAVAGRWDHALSAIVTGLPVVVLAAWWSGRRVAGLVAVGAVAAWALVRVTVVDEPLWSFLLTFAMSLLMLCGAGWLIASLLRANARAAHFAETEPLTGLLNRKAFLGRLESELGRSRRDGHPLTVVFLDCDDFKALNDSAGHRAGDELLQAVAVTLRAGTRRDDVVARLGGDEFALLFPEIPAEHAERVVRRLHDALRQDMSSRHGPLTVSIGLAVFDTPPESTREVMDLADRLMYEAKHSGKDQVVSLLSSGGQPERRRSGSEQKLHSAG